MFILFKRFKLSYFALLFLIIFTVTFLGVLFGTSYFNVKSTYYLNTLGDNLKNEVNILLSGISDDGNNIDFITVLTIKPRRSKIEITQIPTDTLTRIVDTNQPLKNVYSIGDTEIFIQKVSEITGIHFTYYAIGKFQAFENVIDILGNIKYDVPYDMKYNDTKTQTNINVSGNLKEINGKNTLDIIRYSKLNHLPKDTDTFASQLLSVILSQNLNEKDIEKMDNIVREFSQNSNTNLKSDDVETYISIFKSIIVKDIKIKNFGGKYKNIDGYTYFIPDGNLKD